MFYNYFKTAFRNLLRNKGYAAINIVGLAVGIAACLLIFLVIQFKTSFDNFHKKKNEIYRIGTELPYPDGMSYTAGSALSMGPQLRLDFLQVKKVASIFNNGGQIAIDNNDHKKINEDDFFLTDPVKNLRNKKLTTISC